MTEVALIPVKHVILVVTADSAQTAIEPLAVANFLARMVEGDWNPRIRVLT
tara:strand:+ start:2538 stop:2690 length:153 start_codon:yes stop_codon:yes gene_type:complete